MDILVPEIKVQIQYPIVKKMTNLLEPTVEKSTFKMLKKLRVLLAEDNEVNQLLAKSILQYWGFESKVATTGTEVIALMKKEDFDVVLMDIQMPEKSGIEAATEIRRFEDITKRNVPIIALTANALIGEEKKYMAAGMDDFLTKPFKEKELFDVIQRVFNNQGSFGRDLYSTTMEENKPDLPEGEKLYNLQSIFDLARGNEDFVITLVQIFLETIPPDTKAMVKACQEKKWDQVSKLAHKLKSTIDTIKVHSIKEIIRTIELDAKQGVNIAALPALVNKVDSVVEKISIDLRANYDVNKKTL